MRVLWVLALVGALPAGAVSLVTEVTAARPFTGLSLLAEFEVVKDRTFVSACFGSTRSAPLDTGSGAPIDIPRSNQLCLGADHGLNDHWRISGMVSLSPKVKSHIELLPDPSPFYFRAETSSAGLSAGIAYDTGPFVDVEWGVDFSVSATGYTLAHEWVNADGTKRFATPLGAIRPSAGVLWILGDTELSLRGSYTFYLGDPLTAGRVTSDEISAMAQYYQRSLAAREYYDLNQQQATFLEGANRLMQTDAISGLSSAPVWFGIRPSVQHRFAPWFSGQLSYAYDRYVPTQGDTHVLSVKGTATFSEMWRGWAALSAQVDRPVRLPPVTYGILTVGAEVTF
jgi:hypothetical protein